MFLLIALSALLVGPVFAAAMIFPPPPPPAKSCKKNSVSKTDLIFDLRSYLFD